MEIIRGYLGWCKIGRSDPGGGNFDEKTEKSEARFSMAENKMSHI